MRSTAHLRGMAPPPRRLPPHLMPELIIDEILVRFPPEDPAFLVRASVVCKPWRHLLCDPGFRRRYIAFHRSPPLLGFLHNCSMNDAHGKYYIAPRFVSTTTPSPVLPLQPFDDCNYGWSVLDCRHGRVLFKSPYPVRRHRALFNAPEVNESQYLAVWDATTGKHKQMPQPPSSPLPASTIAVLCGVRGCDHLDCQDGPDLVVYVGCNPMSRVVRSHVYSSEASTWSSFSFAGPSAGYATVSRPSVLIGDDIYFVLATRPVVRMAILNIDLANNQISIIDPPHVYDFEGNAVLMATEDGSLDFAVILGSTLSLWSRDVMNSDVLVGGWAKFRVIELQTLIPFKIRPRVVGATEGSGIIFVSTDVGVFSVDLKSGRAKKVDEPRTYSTIFPFMSFYNPDGSSSKLRLPMGHPNHTVE